MIIPRLCAQHCTAAAVRRMFLLATAFIQTIAILTPTVFVRSNSTRDGFRLHSAASSASSYVELYIEPDVRVRLCT